MNIRPVVATNPIGPPLALPTEIGALASALISSQAVGCWDEFWGNLRPVLQTHLPHDRLICSALSWPDQGLLGSYEIGPRLVSYRKNQGRNAAVTGQLCPLIKEWFTHKQPLCRTLDDQPSFLVVHGSILRQRQLALCLSFYGISRWTEREKMLLQFLIPHLQYVRAISIFCPNGTQEATTSELTVREKEVLHWVRLGKSNAEIAQILSLSSWTTKAHVANIIRKLNVSTRGQAVANALQQGLLN